MAAKWSWLLALGLAACSGHHAHHSETTEDEVRPLALPGGSAGIGFDDLQYDPDLERLLVPAGRTGRLDLVDPLTGAIKEVTGFSARDDFDGGHAQGTTSAVHAGDWLVAIDRTTKRLEVVDPATLAIVDGAPLAASPEYVRWIGGEVWVTEPEAEQIEVFSVPSHGDHQPTRMTTIAVPGGPESLIESASRGRAYSHLWKGKTVAIDVISHQVIATWSNQCHDSRGIALDEPRGWLFAACSEGKVVALDVDHDGAVLGSAKTGDGIDVIAYAPALRHLYVPAARAATLSIVQVSDDGKLSVSGERSIAEGGHCATTDGRGDIWICDPAGGRLLQLHDPTAR